MAEIERLLHAKWQGQRQVQWWFILYEEFTIIMYPGTKRNIPTITIATANISIYQTGIYQWMLKMLIESRPPESLFFSRAI